MEYEWDDRGGDQFWRDVHGCKVVRFGKTSNGAGYRQVVCPLPFLPGADVEVRGCVMGGDDEADRMAAAFAALAGAFRIDVLARVSAVPPSVAHTAVADVADSQASA